jgi:tRNA(adenine34) deaminase
MAFEMASLAGAWHLQKVSSNNVDSPGTSLRTKSDEGSDARFMRMALREARTAAEHGQMPFGAVVVDKDGRLVGKGHNRVRTDQDPTAHGEVVAIRNAWRKVGEWQSLTGGTLYTSCEPCLLCSFVITQVGFSRVVYAARGTDVPTYRSLLDSDFSKAADWINAQPDWEHIVVVGDFMRGPARSILAAFPWADDYAKKTTANSNSGLARKE